MKFVILTYLNWDYEENEYILDEGVSFVNLKTHPIGKLYKKICTIDNIDDGTPYFYSTGLILYDETDEDHSFLPSISHNSLSSIFINLLTIIYKGRLGYQSRVIMSKDNFKSSHLTYELYERSTMFIDELDELHALQIKFDKNNIKLLNTIWNNLKSIYLSKIYSTNENKSRINNVLNFFYFSWNTLTLDLTGISLSIVLETLFSPHSNTELTHQISYNIANFMGNSKQDKINIYKSVKKYYSIRSKLVHGETIKEEDKNSIPEFFRFICEIILKIMIDTELIHTFNDNNLRKKYLENKLFE